jgi:hypothetical protein
MSFRQSSKVVSLPSFAAVVVALASVACSSGSSEEVGKTDQRIGYGGDLGSSGGTSASGAGDGYLASASGTGSGGGSASASASGNTETVSATTCNAGETLSVETRTRSYTLNGATRTNGGVSNHPAFCEVRNGQAYLDFTIYCRCAFKPADAGFCPGGRVAAGPTGDAPDRNVNISENGLHVVNLPAGASCSGRSTADDDAVWNANPPADTICDWPCTFATAPAPVAQDATCCTPQT